MSNFSVDRILDFMVAERLLILREKEKTSGVINLTFLTGELYALDRIRFFIEENLK